MKPSQQIIQFIANCEGFRSEAYQPVPGDHWTIGYGSTYWNGQEVHEGEFMDETTAFSLLSDTVNNVASGISKRQIPLSVTQNQFDAVVSLVYNIGINTWMNSNTSKMFYAGQNISDRLVRFDISEGKVVPGLLDRRLKEQNIYDNANYGEGVV